MCDLSPQVRPIRDTVPKVFPVSCSHRHLLSGTYQNSRRKANVQHKPHCYIRNLGASLVAQWLRICLPMQGTRVRALVWEDPTCCGATKPVSHNY